MPLIIIAIVTILISICGLFFFIGYSQTAHQSGRKADSVMVQSKSKKGLSREDIVKKLKKLSESPAPKNLSPGAMCYAVMGGPPDREEYVCPVCGTKTLYATSGTKSITENASYETVLKVGAEIPACRRIVAEITEVPVKLNESRFCSHCSPAVKDPMLSLKIFYSDTENPYEIMDIDPDDCQLLKDFFSGSQKHEGDQGRESALKESLPRLKQLLGIPDSIKIK